MRKTGLNRLYISVQSALMGGLMSIDPHPDQLLRLIYTLNLLIYRHSFVNFYGSQGIEILKRMKDFFFYKNLIN